MAHTAYTYPYDRRHLESAANEVTARFRRGGALALRISRLAEPTAMESCALLEAIWKKSKLPLATLAALVGTTHVTIDSWVNYRRKPSRAARRAIWLLHRLMMRPEDPLNLSTWLTWG